MGGIPALTDIHCSRSFSAPEALHSTGGMYDKLAGTQVRHYALHRNVHFFGAGGYQLCAAVAAVFSSGDFWFSEQHVVHVFDYGYSAFMPVANTCL